MITTSDLIPAAPNNSVGTQASASESRGSSGKGGAFSEILASQHQRQSREADRSSSKKQSETAAKNGQSAGNKLQSDGKSLPQEKKLTGAGDTTAKAASEKASHGKTPLAESGAESAPSEITHPELTENQGLIGAGANETPDADETAVDTESALEGLPLTAQAGPVSMSDENPGAGDSSEIKDGFSYFLPGRGEFAGEISDLPVSARRAAIPLALDAQRPGSGQPGFTTSLPSVTSTAATSADQLSGNMAEQSQALNQWFDRQMAERLTGSEAKLFNTFPGLNSAGQHNPVSESATLAPASLSATNLSDTLATQRAPSALHLSTPVVDPRWGGDLAAQVKFMVSHSMEKATIQLSPPDMGPLEIKISTEGDQAKVHFVVNNPATRDAIEQAVPRLRELLEQGGLQLAQSQVSDNGQQNPDPRSQASSGSDMGMISAASGPDESVNEQILTMAPGNTAIDFYI